MSPSLRTVKINTEDKSILIPVDRIDYVIADDASVKVFMVSGSHLVVSGATNPMEVLDAIQESMGSDDE